MPVCIPVVANWLGSFSRSVQLFSVNTHFKNHVVVRCSMSNVPMFIIAASSVNPRIFSDKFLLHPLRFGLFSLSFNGRFSSFVFRLGEEYESR